MDRRDLATSHVKRKHMKHHLSYHDLTLQMCFVGFNLSRYNSLDEWLKLNHFKNDSSMSHSAPSTPSLK